MRIMRRQIVFLLVLTFMDITKVMAYTPPPIKIEALSPKGIRITMPDDDFLAFTLHANLKRGNETKQWNTYIPKAEEGNWIFIDRNFELKIGDAIFYFVIVVKDGEPYEARGNWTIDEIVIDKDVPSCEYSETNTLCSKEICKNTLIFSEEFNDANNFKWNKENIFPQEPDYPFNAYSEDKIQVSNGTLIIAAARTSSGLSTHWNFGYACTGEAGTKECVQTSSGVQIVPPTISGKITTRNLFSFKYGRIEVRAKLPVGDWLIPEINLEPLYNEYGKYRYGSGLIRIACVKGNQVFSKELYGGPIVCDTEPHRSSFLQTLNIPSGQWNEDFHIYTLTWKPNGIQLFVDGLLYGDIHANNISDVNYDVNNVPYAEMWRRGSSIAPLDKMFYISLGVRVGGINDFPDVPEKPWKNISNKAMYRFWENTYFWHKTWVAPELVVDYVRVYSL